MLLDLYVGTKKSPVATIHNIGTDADAEWYVTRTAQRDSGIVRWILTGSEKRAEWKRFAQQPALPNLVFKAADYSGSWKDPFDHRSAAGT